MTWKLNCKFSIQIFFGPKHLSFSFFSFLFQRSQNFFLILHRYEYIRGRNNSGKNEGKKWGKEGWRTIRATKYISSMKYINDGASNFLEKDLDYARLSVSE